MHSPYDFLLDTFETEILKTITIWRAFPEEKMGFRPAAKSRTVLEQFEHHVLSESGWMKRMFGIDTGDPQPAQRTKQGYIDKYEADAHRRLKELRAKPAEWWQESVDFFDARRSRAWVMTRRIAHGTHHRGQLIVYLRLLDCRVPSVYGPTADTGDKVDYSV